MTVTRNSDGKFEVSDRGGRLAGPFETNAEAWRWIDRYSGEPISPAEKRAEWATRSE